MTSQAFNFSGVGQETGAALTIPAGGLVRVRIAASVGFPQLGISVTQNGVTNIAPIRQIAAGAMEVPLIASGDTIALNYTGQTPEDQLSGILEVFINPVFAAVLAGSGGTVTAGTLDFSQSGNPLSADL